MPLLAASIWSEQIYWWMAIFGTSLFILKMLVSFIGGAMDSGDFGGGDIHDGDLPSDHGSFSVFTFLSIQSLLAFFMGMGWMGVIAGTQWEFRQIPTMLMAVGFGLFLLILNGVIMLLVRRLHSEAHYDLQTCKNRTGRVYMSIPPKGQGVGQVEVNVSGQRKIIRALSSGPAIPSFTDVQVIDIVDGQFLLVAAQNQQHVSANVSPGQSTT